jgi:hypothetical protein
MNIIARIRSAAEVGQALFAGIAHVAEMSRRAAEVARLAAALTDREEAERLHRMVYRVAIREAMEMPHVLASTRVRQYLDALHDRAARGEAIPQNDEELRKMPEAVMWRAVDLAKAVGLG